MNYKKISITVLLLALGLNFLWAKKDNRPNIVFVMMDDLGAEAIGAYGGESYETPCMDALAKKRMLFENAYAAPACMISRATLMSGRYGFRSGLPRNITKVACTDGGWGKNEVTVANVLQDVGYTTAISGKWHLAQHDLYPDHLTDKGFEYQNSWAWVIGKQRTRRYWEATHFREKSLVVDPPKVYGPDEFCKYITNFMQEHKDKDKPFFAYYPMVLLHSPWPQTPDNINDPQEGWLPSDNLRTHGKKKWSNQNLIAMVAYADKIIGRIVQSIEDMGIAENTLLIVTSDNGTYTKASSQYKGMTIPGGKMKVQESGARVPFFAYWKGKIVPGSVNENLIDFTDVLPTFAELAGAPLPTKNPLDGTSFLGQMLPKEYAVKKRDYIFFGNGNNCLIRSKDYFLNARDEFCSVQKNRYLPDTISSKDYTEEHLAQIDMLKTALDKMKHPYGGAEKSKEKKKKKEVN